jgi:hypothetical protein
LTGEQRFVATLPAAQEWMKRSLLPDGRLSRYYELISNKPLYMTADYLLTHDDGRLPKHYGWKTESQLAEIDAALETWRDGGGKPKQEEVTEAEVQAILAALDDEGKWVSQYDGEMIVGQPKFKLGQPYVSSAVLVERVKKLCLFLNR